MRGCAASCGREPTMIEVDRRAARRCRPATSIHSPWRPNAVFSAASGCCARRDRLREQAHEVAPALLGVRDLDVRRALTRRGRQRARPSSSTSCRDGSPNAASSSRRRTSASAGVGRGAGSELEAVRRERLQVRVAPVLAPPRRPTRCVELCERVETRGARRLRPRHRGAVRQWDRAAFTRVLRPESSRSRARRARGRAPCRRT